VISLLLALTVGVVGAGHLSGLGSLHLGGGPGPSIQGGLNPGENGNGSRISTVNGSATATATLAPIPISGPSAGLTFPYLLLYAAAGIVLAAGLVSLLRSSGEAGVYDFAAAIDQLEKQRSLIQGSWSRELRNVALLRYYSLMRSICARMGLADLPSETPLEYLGRVAAALRISQIDAADFAAAFERARYGGELSDADARNASEHMARFVDGLRRGAVHG